MKGYILKGEQVIKDPNDPNKKHKTVFYTGTTDSSTNIFAVLDNPFVNLDDVNEYIVNHTAQARSGIRKMFCFHDAKGNELYTNPFGNKMDVLHEASSWKVITLPKELEPFKSVRELTNHLLQEWWKGIIIDPSSIKPMKADENKVKFLTKLWFIEEANKGLSHTDFEIGELERRIHENDVKRLSQYKQRVDLIKSVSKLKRDIDKLVQKHPEFKETRGYGAMEKYPR